MSSSKPAGLFDKIFRSDDGKLVIGQKPNLPIVGWVVFLLLAIMVKHGRLHDGFQSLSDAFLFVWAYLEIRQGESIFRRMLGGVVAVIVVYAFFSAA